MSYQKGFDYLATLGVDTADIIANYTNRKLYREPSKYFDGKMYDAIKPVLLKRSPRVAKEIERAIHDKKITKQFCDTSKLDEQVLRFEDQSGFTKSMQGNCNYEAAWQILREMLPQPTGQLQPLCIDESTDIREVFSNPDASSGIIAYPAHKREAADRIKEVALHIMKEYDQNLSFPAIALTRSQITDYVVDGKVDSSGIKYKTRLVMCVDAASVLVEQRVGQPLLDYVMKPCHQYAGGSNDDEIREFLVRTCRGKNWVSLDYSKFDATIQAWLIKDVFNFLSEYYPPSERKAFEWISHNFIHMQLLMPDGRIHNLHKGIKSGSYFTQIVGSLCNILMILTYLVSKYGHPNGDKRTVDLAPVRTQLKARDSEFAKNFTMVAMGDDNILFTYDELDMKDLSTYLYHNFHAIVTVEGEKGYQRGTPMDAPSFLKRVWKQGGQEREEIEMWVNLLHPERKRDYSQYSPYHILYGYFLTFRGTMKNYYTSIELVKLMYHGQGGLSALARIKLNDLPGSFRSQVMNRGVNREQLVSQLKQDMQYLRAS